MSLIQTTIGRIVLKNAESLSVVPYVYDRTIGDYVLGEDVYDISAVIGDSITIEQSDGNTEAKYNEFKATPLIESVSGTKYAFTAQCLDLQNSVLQSLFGAMVGNGYNGAVNGAVAFNDDFVLLYALIRIRFADESLPDVVMPKVQLNSKLFVQQLKARASQGNIAGTAMPCHIVVEDTRRQGYLVQFSSIASGNTFSPYTPVVFVPRDYIAAFSNRRNFTVINFSNSNQTRIYVDTERGRWSNVPF